MKKSLIVAAATVLGMGLGNATLSTAGTGLTVGVKLGTDSAKVKPYLTEFVTTSGVATNGAPFNSSIGRTAFAGEIMAQYGMMFPHCFYGSVEVLFGLNNNTINVWNTTSDIYTVKSKNYYGAFVNLGIFANEKAIVYVKLGGTSTNYTASATNIAGTSSFYGSKRSFAFTPGIGTQVAINNTMAFVAEMRATFNQKLPNVTWTDSTNTFQSNSGKVFTTSFRAGLTFKVA